MAEYVTTARSIDQKITNKLTKSLQQSPFQYDMRPFLTPVNSAKQAS